MRISAARYVADVGAARSVAVGDGEEHAIRNTRSKAKAMKALDLAVSGLFIVGSFWYLGPMCDCLEGYCGMQWG